MTIFSPNKARTTLTVLCLSALILPCNLAAAKFDLDCNVSAASSLKCQVTLLESLTLPFLVGQGPLFSGNQLKFSLGQAVTPVSLNASLDIGWTPIAFFKLVAGLGVGSGWNIGIANGLGVNQRVNLHDNQVGTRPFIGVVGKIKVGAVVQFDLAAVVPGDWNHIQFFSYQELGYRALSGVADDVSWLWEADQGENRNGWNYYANYFVGYKMPIFLENIGVLVETNLPLYQTAGRVLWGDNYLYFNGGPVLNFRLSEQTTLAVLVQFETKRNFLNDTGSYGFYQDRVINAANPLRLQFNRVALSLDIHLTEQEL